MEENENVFCFLKNCPEFLISLFAILKCGAVFVPINTELRGKFLDHQFRNCEPKIAIVNNSLIDSFLDLDPLATKLKTTIFVGKTFEKKIRIYLSCLFINHKSLTFKSILLKLFETLKL